MRFWLIVLASWMGGCSCGGDAGRLAVDLKTDLRAGIDFVEVRTFVYAGREVAASGREAIVVAPRGTDFVAGLRVAELGGLGTGSHGVRVRLIDPIGDVLAQRLVLVDVGPGNTVVRVVIAAECGADVECGDCNEDGDCTAGPACTTPVCTDGTCLARPDDSRCASGEYCSPTDGCVGVPIVPDAGPRDSGPVARDTGPAPECGSDGDCPPREEGAWSGCTGFDGPCDDSGTETREVTAWSCSGGACVSRTMSDSRSCTRGSREGTSCGSDDVGGWSSCNYADACDESAERQRTITTFRCRSGSCDGAGRTETEPCTRTTGGTTCATGSYCGSPVPCRVCRGGACVVNDPDVDAACNPSCGAASSLCGGTPMCCPGSATGCPTVGPGPWADCAVCCQGGVCY